MPIQKSVRFGGVTEMIADTPPPSKGCKVMSSNLICRPTSIWFTAEEMGKQFDADLEEADTWDMGCLRGLEYHLEKNADRRKFSKLYVQVVVHHFLGLKNAAYRGKKVNVDEGLQRFAAKLSRDSRAFAKRIAKSDEKSALMIHSYTPEEIISRSKADDSRMSYWDPICVGKSCQFEVVSSYGGNSLVA